ncbi:hypothetical protein HUW51_17600 [Adhaeribacter swui]|uniref:histidine kinase n=1 Tax=Adhaeribacter swui TaxID=2086471 RepID=A0A7G7GBB7_9BACT|nr:two-component regulator propeller domain-containing protein [Adhaeribacter swui]QNF34451.1 hypothetical protein HUW51_17600 [Adhaeribacter swui]
MKKLYGLLILLISFPGLSQIRELNFTRLSVENGLPENFITCSLQDKLGYMWFGTQNGLVRYDGYNLKVYNLETADKKDRTFRSVWYIFEDSKDNLWIGTLQQGVFRFNRSQDNFTHFPHLSSKKEIEMNGWTVVKAEDKEGYLWIANLTVEFQKHIDRFHPVTGDMVTYDSLATGKYHLPTNDFNELINDSKGRVWLGTQNGLYQYNAHKKKFDQFLASPDTANKQYIAYLYEAPSQPGLLWLIIRTKAGSRLVQYNPDTKSIKSFKSPVSGQGTEKMLTLFEDKAHRLWVGTNKGILKFNPSGGTFTSYKVNDKNLEADADSCFDIREGRNGALWVLSGKGLLYLASPGAALRRFAADENKPGGLPTNVLQNSFVDRNGSLWVAGRGHGIFRLNEKQSQFQFIQQTGTGAGYPGGYAYSIARLKSGKYLISTPKGLFESDKNLTQFESVNLAAGKLIQVRRAILIDKEGIAWIGSLNDGLFRYDPQTKKVTNYKNKKTDSTSLSNDAVISILEDSRGNLWVGTHKGGLCRLVRQSGKFTRYPYIVNSGNNAPEKGELDDIQVNSLFEDSQGILWVGTNGGGLNKLNLKTGKFTSYYNSDKGLQCITSIFEDRQGRLWAGTYLWGLFLFDRKTGHYRRFTEKEGLVYDNISTIREDKAGNLWLGGGRGYSIMNPRNFAIRQLTLQNGLPAGDMVYGGSATASNGDWLAGTSTGILRFNPDNLVYNTTRPEVILQTMSFTNQNKAGTRDSIIILTNQKRIELKYNQNRVTFQFVAFHYANPSFNQYKYRLSGYDTNWISGGTQRSATYTNLAPGTYTFSVKAASSDGLWNERDATITVIIHPPWWRTWWAYTFYIILFAAVLRMYILHRSRVLRRENQLLESKVNLRTSQLSQANEEISQALANLKTSQTQLIQSEKMASLGELTAGIAHEIQNPLNFVNNFSEVSIELLDELEEEAQNGNTTEVLAISTDLKENLQKINYHGKRADAIVKGMLQHSRAGSTEKQLTNINALADEYLRLSYHGLRAKDKEFNAALVKDFAPDLPKTEVLPQDLGRVLLNLFNNAFYAVAQKKQLLNGQYHPEVQVITKDLGDKIEIRIRDNGSGIPENIKQKVFQPFFTTKPTGQGTGLGLSLSYDIINKGHGGQLKLETEEGKGADFIIILPVKPGL